MTNKRVRVSTQALALLLASMVPVAAQEPEHPLELDFDSVQTESQGQYNLMEEQIPLSQIVRGMFPIIGNTLANRRSELRGAYLQDAFGIAEGSPHEGALLRAILADREATPDEPEKARRRDQLTEILAAEGDDAYMRKSAENLEEDSRRLGVVWGQFVADLGGPGSKAMVKIREYLERQRRGLAIASNNSFEDPDHIVWRMERVFQAGVNSVPGAKP